MTLWTIRHVAGGTDPADEWTTVRSDTPPIEARTKEEAARLALDRDGALSVLDDEQIWVWPGTGGDRFDTPPGDPVFRWWCDGQKRGEPWPPRPIAGVEQVRYEPWPLDVKVPRD